MVKPQVVDDALLAYRRVVPVHVCIDRVSDHHRSADSLSGCIWNDTVVPFCSFPMGHFLLKSEYQLE